MSEKGNKRQTRKDKTMRSQRPLSVISLLSHSWRLSSSLLISLQRRQTKDISRYEN